ncbi:hypothetical protein B0A50_07411 [Salinomyces thailandicus]|uniref:Uncharacterized protein n=1 Tax=Salinomyces thailandicus TaxID=706561 RepID=A0A4U0TMC8_9PEZI|nr:hypothetical protein B0A50_07411 [Salinomyces thailandica]
MTNQPLQVPELDTDSDGDSSSPLSADSNEAAIANLAADSRSDNPPSSSLSGSDSQLVDETLDGLTKSPLGLLPPELRNRIYEYAFAQDKPFLVAYHYTVILIQASAVSGPVEVGQKI